MKKFLLFSSLFIFSFSISYASNTHPRTKIESKVVMSIDHSDFAFSADNAKINNDEIPDCDCWIITVRCMCITKQFQYCEGEGCPVHPDPWETSNAICCNMCGQCGE